jgi:hypothetical protein
MDTTTTAVTTPSKKFGLSSISFLIATLLFLLPFVEIRCNGQTVATNSGIGLAFGTDYKTSNEMKSLTDPFGNPSEKKITEKQGGDMYVSALIALIMGVIGVALSFMNPTPNKAGIIIGTLAAVCLIVLMIQIQMDIKDKPVSRGEDNLGSNIKITAVFTAWYYLSLISFIAAAFFNYRQKPIVISG